MPNSNVTSSTSFWGASDTTRYGLTPARKEKPLETARRRVSQGYKWVQGDQDVYEKARQAGKVTYSPKG